ncbi:MAG: preprotein translocase subunit YajC [Actinomycetota bacterium]
MGESSWMSIILIVGLIAIFYFMLIRPQQKRMRQQMDLINSLRAGDDVMTSSGIYGTVVEVEEDSVILEISDDVHIRLAKSAIARTFTVREEPEDEEEEEAIEGETVEAPAEEGEEEAASPEEQGSPNGSSKRK